MAAQSTDEFLNHVIGVLRARQAALVQMGVLHAAVFGSVARGDNRDDSDVDVMVDVDPAKVATIFDIGEIQQSLEEWVGVPSMWPAVTGCGRTSLSKLSRRPCMPSSRPIDRLRDIVENCERIERHIVGMDFDAYVRDEKTRDAVER